MVTIWQVRFHHNLLFGIWDPDPDLKQFAEAVGRAGRDLAEAITIVGYNVNFEEYLIFKSQAPVIHQMYKGDMVVHWLIESLPTDGELVRRCVNFVIDTAIRLEAM